MRMDIMLRIFPGKKRLNDVNFAEKKENPNSLLNTSLRTLWFVSKERTLRKYAVNL